MATGLAWTPVGGDVLFVEAIAYPGEGKLQITGQLGDVMKSKGGRALLRGERRPRRGAQRRPARVTGSAATTFTCTCPPGAIQKDGPSAGDHDGHRDRVQHHGAAACAPTPPWPGKIAPPARCCRSAAWRKGARRAAPPTSTGWIVPRRNEADIDDVPEHLRKRMQFVLVDDADEVLDAAWKSPARSEEAEPNPLGNFRSAALSPGTSVRVQCPQASGS